MLKKSGWKDTKLEDRDFVKIEIIPKKLSMDMSNWTFQVDEKGTLPAWFNENIDRYKKLCYQTLIAYLKECHIDKVEKFIDSLKDVKWFKPDGKPNKEWKIFYGKDLNAARGAAWDAARGAARDAARDAALQSYNIITSDLKIAKKHREFVRKYWEVWTKGYGLIGDVDGVLYVYAPEEFKPKEDKHE